MSIDELSLFVDVDGTLLDIAPRPDDVRASREILSTLATLLGVLEGALAIVSGRRIEDIDRLFAPLRLPASGIHGAQLRAAPNSPILDGAALDLPAGLAADVDDIARRYPGVFVEDKGKALAVHWRAAPEAEPGLFADLERLAARGDAPVALMRGHCVFELKSPSTSKGEAVRAFMELPPFAGRRPVFIGDDVTDIAGMAAARELGGQAFSVGQPLEGAEGVFASPAEVRGWLARLARPQPEARRA